MSAAAKPNKPISLTQFLIEEQRDKQHIDADLRLLIEVVARACKAISIAVGKGALRVPVFVGSNNEIERVTRYHQELARA